MSRKLLRIGFFDSGIGGLSVLRHAPKRLGSAEYIYVADSAYAPYGEKSLELVRQRSLAISRFLHAQGVDAIVIACNTATAVAAENIRQELDIPVVAMEPAIKPAMQSSRNKQVVVLATKSTLNSSRYQHLKDHHAPQGQVIERACHEWVEALERGNLDSAAKLKLVSDELHDIRSSKSDTYILGCTHFAFLEKEIRLLLKNGERVIDPAPAVIEQLGRRLCITDVPTEPGQIRQFTLYTSGSRKHVEERVSQLLGLNVSVRSLQF